MHYVGIHGLSGNFAIAHDTPMILLSIVIAIVTAYGGLRAFLARQDGVRLIPSSIAFGIAVSGMHYTAMHGMHFVAAGGGGASPCGRTGGVAANARGDRCGAVFCHCRGFFAFAGAGAAPPEAFAAVAVAIDPAPETAGHRPATRIARAGNDVTAVDAFAARRHRAAAPRRARCRGFRSRGSMAPISSIRPRCTCAPTLGRPGCMTAPASRCARRRSGRRRPLDPRLFVRVHRSHIVAIPHVSFVRKEGDGAVIELDGPSPHRVPVSRGEDRRGQGEAGACFLQGGMR